VSVYVGLGLFIAIPFSTFSDFRAAIYHLHYQLYKLLKYAMVTEGIRERM
jgi:hypothetical protein